MLRVSISLMISVFLPLSCFAQIIQWSSANALGRSSCEVGVADLDGDGHVDIAVAGATQRWYKGPDFTNFYTIGTSDGGPYAARVADINGDGWPDFVTSDGARNAGDIPGEIYLYLNPGAGGNHTAQWQRITVYSGNVRHQNDMRIADMDGDGRLDIIERTWSSERVVVALQNANINNWTVRAFDTGENGKPEGISAGDIDGDGENEIVLSGVYWDNPGGWRTGNPVEYSIDPLFVQEEVKSAVGDIDNDGDNDVYMGSAEGAFKFLAWYENTGIGMNGGVSFTKHIIKNNFGKCHMVELIDVDQDNDLDLCTGQSFGEKGCLIFYNNNNGSSWTEQDFDPNGGFYTGIIADLDGDGDLDAVGPKGFYDPIFYYYNQSPVSPPDPPTNLSANLVNGLQIDLSWTDEADNEGSYQIERNDGGGWQPIATIAANSETYSDLSSLPSTIYQYRVRAANLAGTSAWLTSGNVQTWDQAGVVSITPAGGNFINPPTITISAALPYSEIRYTLDGSTPSSSSILYTGPFVLSQSGLISAIAIGPQLIDSDLASETYYVAINGNFPPQADAGLDQNRFDLNSVSLDGSNSSDLDDPPASLSFSWVQLSGPVVSLNNATTSTPDFVPPTAGTYIFELTVSDEAASDQDQVSITVSEFDANLVAYWPMDETSGSSIANVVNNQNSSLNVGASLSANGKRNGCVHFNGVSGRVEGPAVNVSGDELTIAFWMNASSLTNVEGRMISKATGTSGNDHEWMISQNGGSALRFRLSTDNGGTATLISNTGELTAGDWYFVTAVYDGAEMRLYKDAALISSLVKSGNLQVGVNTAVAIGNQPSGAGDRPFDGRIDEVRIYDTALDLVEIAALYNQGASTFPVELADFELTEVDGKSLLSWKTLSENNSDYFAIERRSQGENIFSEIGQLPAQGTSNSVVAYQFVDDNPLPGENSYRLRQLDLDQQAYYSTILSLYVELDGAISIFPNPFRQVLNVETRVEGAALVELIDLRGRLLHRQFLVDGQTQLSLSEVSDGLYQLLIKSPRDEFLASRMVMKRD
ncbi:MAG: LamG-like jellyroll fold domain-containing protein [Bacteroidota bacterium]